MTDPTSTSSNEPMIKLDPNPTQVPILSYNVPEPTSYTGVNYLELNFIPDNAKPEDYFKPECFKSKSTTGKVGQNLQLLFNRNNAVTSLLQNRYGINVSQIGVNIPKVANSLSQGNKVVVYKNLFGDRKVVTIPQNPTVIRPRIVLIETYRLSTFTGNYGAGKVLKTFSLLPGEKTRISIKSYQRSEVTSKQASSILDSFTSESADDFENSVASENSFKQNEAENFEYHAEAEASCSWGIGEAKVSGGVKGGTNSSREEFAKNVQNATTKHANKASANRDVQVNTSSESKTETGEETEIIREIENINVSRTLNFVFRQMNQEFITILHLVDLRLGFFNGENSSKKEFTLPEVDQLINQYIINDQKKRDEVKQMILDQILSIVDYLDNPITKTNFFCDEDGTVSPRPIIEQKSYTDQNGNPIRPYYQLSKGLFSLYKYLTRNIPVQGLILSGKRNVMRTDGVIVDAILGQGDALDSYSHGLQGEAVRERQLKNDLLEMEKNKQLEAQQIVTAKDSAGADIFSKVYPLPSILKEDEDE